MGGLALRRASARRTLLAGLALLVAAATALVALTIAGAGVTATAASRSAIDGQLGGAPAWEIRTRIAEDPAAQDAAARAGIAAVTEGLTTEVGRTMVSEGKRADTGDGTRQVASADPSAVVVEGTWPGAGELLAPADLALAPGTTVEVAGTAHTVSGTWSRPEPAVAGTPTVLAEDPFLLPDDEALAAVESAPFVYWDIRLDPSGLDLEALDDLATVAARLDAELRDAEDVVVRGLQVTDGLDTGGGQLAEA
ncbi:MAG: hypothetical protein Q4G64_03740, partial [bacterium]|nr:hypothetical protein [bacterium]